MMTRSFHVETGKVAKEAQPDVYDLGHDEAGLVAGGQSNPKSNLSSRRGSQSTS